MVETCWMSMSTYFCCMQSSEGLSSASWRFSTGEISCLSCCGLLSVCFRAAGSGRSAWVHVALCWPKKINIVMCYMLFCNFLYSAICPFTQIAFVLYPPSEVTWDLSDHNNNMFITMCYSWHLAFALLIVAIAHTTVLWWVLSDSQIMFSYLDYLSTVKSFCTLRFACMLLSY